MQGRDGVKKRVSAFVIAAQQLTQGLLQQFFVKHWRAAVQAGQTLVGVEQAARVAIGKSHQTVMCRRGQGRGLQSSLRADDQAA